MVPQTARKATADKYRRGAHELMKVGGKEQIELADKMIAWADKLDPVEEFFAPTEGADGMFQAAKYGSDPRALNVKGKAPELPSEVRAVEHVLAESLGGTGAKGLSILDAYRRSGAPGGVTVKLPAGEDAYAKATGTNLAEREKGILTKGEAAYDTIRASHQLLSALDSGAIISGVGADVRVDLARLGQLLGVGGKTGEEALANTSKAMQAMAAAELSAAQENRGLGQLTENERVIVRNAALGNIARTPAEMRMLASGLEKLARHRIATARKVQEGMARNPGTVGLATTFSFEDPPAYVSPKAPKAAVGASDMDRFFPSLGGK
jgi:hypothetical protein